MVQQMTVHVPIVKMTFRVNACAEGTIADRQCCAFNRTQIVIAMANLAPSATENLLNVKNYDVGTQILSNNIKDWRRADACL